MEQNKFEITTRTGEVISLTKDVVKNYLCNGQDITNSEFTMFFQLCKVHKVNPFLKEAYIVKYGNQPATIILDYKVLQQCAEENPNFKGMKTGILVVDKNGNEKEREGAYLLPNETLIAGWCEVKRADREYPTKVYAMFDEFKQCKKDGELNSNWSGKPVFMIVKVAKAQALREAFPNMFGSNVYTKDEAETFIDNRDFINATSEEVKQEVNNNIVNAKKINNKFDDFEDNEENNGYDNNTGELTEEQQKEIFNKHIKDSLYD